MLPRTVTIIAIALVAALGAPAGGAATPTGCDTVPREEERLGHSFRIDEDTYLYLPQGQASDAEKVGLWEETNELDFLQTEECRGAGGLHLYFADAFAGPAIP